MSERRLITPEIYASFRSGEYIGIDHYDGNSDLLISCNSYYYRVNDSCFEICDSNKDIKEARKICSDFMNKNHIFSDIDYENKEKHLNQKDIYDLIIDPITEIVKNKTGKDCLFYCFQDRFTLKIGD